MAKKRARRKATSKASAKSAPKRVGSLRCPDCGFRAAHAMGLGRHRSARHGVVSKRQQMQKGQGTWLTRQEAARRARVHYNTIRTWERSGLVRSKKQGREILIDGKSLARASTASGTTPLGTVDIGAAMAELERFYTELSAGLRRLVEAADASRVALKSNGGSKSRAKAARGR